MSRCFFVAVLFLVACMGDAASQDSRPKKEADPNKSVKPGINKKFLDPKLDVDDFVDRFEGESREVFRQRKALVAALGLKAGQSVADIGAGTGLFEPFFAAAVGEKGKVYALDIAKPFVELITRRAKARGLKQIEARVCGEKDIGLPAASVDAAFICDTYHHFEYPGQSLASIHKALKPGGTLLLIDFERIPGKTSEWILKHVRAGKKVFRAEVEKAGFEFVEQVALDGMKDNYILRFRKKP